MKTETRTKRKYTRRQSKNTTEKKQLAKIIRQLSSIPPDRASRFLRAATVMFS